MICTKFEAAKLRNQLRKMGNDISFFRSSKDKHGQPTGDNADYILTTICLYHEQNSNIQLTTGDTTTTRTKKIPMLLCLYSSLIGNDGEIALRPNDMTQFNGKLYKVQGVVNVQEWNIIADISLEVVDDGVQA